MTIMPDIAYTLTDPNIVLSHMAAAPWLTRDEDSRLRQQELKAHVMSGDYFSLLATRLDEVSQNLKTNPAPESGVLQSIVDDLLYLQRHYRIVRKTDALQ